MRVALASQAANLLTFGSLWVLQYFLLDRVLFGRRESGPTGEAPAGAVPWKSPSGDWSGRPKRLPGPRTRRLEPKGKAGASVTGDGWTRLEGLYGGHNCRSQT